MSNKLPKATDFITGLESPPEDYVPVTPSDSNDLADGVARTLYIGSGAGKNVVVITRAGNTRTIPVADNFFLYGQFSRVKSTGTTATSIFALY